MSLITAVLKWVGFAYNATCRLASDYDWLQGVTWILNDTIIFTVI